MTVPTPQPGIMDIAPYVGGESKLDGVTRIVKLASNENPLGCSPRARAAFVEAATGLHRYPDGGATALRAALAGRNGIDPSRIVCGSGSDELIGLLCQAYAGPGDEVLYTEHGFLMYPIYAKGAGATPVKAPETGLRADVDKLLAAVTDRTRILFLANPNNPTGTYLSADELRALRQGLRGDVLLVIDAAYAEYVTANDYGSGAELVETTDNTVMTRTFSKIYGLPALRLGWAYGPPEVIDVINRVRGPFNVNAAAQAAGLAALADQEFVDMSRAHNTYWLDWLHTRLRGLGLGTTDSVGNFALARFETPDRAEAADSFLRNRGLIVRRMAGYGLAESLRLTLGTGEETEMLAAALADFVEGG